MLSGLLSMLVWFVTWCFYLQDRKKFLGSEMSQATVLLSNVLILRMRQDNHATCSKYIGLSIPGRSPLATTSIWAAKVYICQQLKRSFGVLLVYFPNQKKRKFFLTLRLMYFHFWDEFFLSNLNFFLFKIATCIALPVIHTVNLCEYMKGWPLTLSVSVTEGMLVNIIS